MTAVSMFVQRAAAHLVTDAAFYSPDGVMHSACSKVATIGRLRLAVAVSGAAMPWQVIAYLARCETQEEVLQTLPGSAGGLRIELAQNNPTWEAVPGRSSLNEFQLFLALWRDTADRPEGYVLSTEQAWIGGDYEPYTLREVEQLAAPPPVGVPPFADLEQFKPDSDGGRILDAQRAYRNEGSCYVGGFGEVTTVSRTGIVTRRVRSWPDRLGEPIAA